jgi:transposase-like protein
MGILVAKKKRKRRQFTPEYKAEIVALIKKTGKSIGHVARELDLTETNVRDWVKKADQGNPPAEPPSDADLRAELVAAQKRIRELEMERAILKRAAAFFAKESS